jgi:hypothetical protein
MTHFPSPANKRGFENDNDNDNDDDNDKYNKIRRRYIIR